MFLNNLTIHTVLCLISFESAILLNMCDDYMHLFRQNIIYSKEYVEKWAQGAAVSEG